MIKKGMTALLIFMALSSTVAQAKIISYEVKTNGGPIKSYATDQLVDGFLAYKQGEHSEIYINFIKDLKSGKYEAFQDDTKKYVSYDLIVQAFLEAKENNKSFNVEEFVKHAKGIDLTTGGQGFTKDDIKDSDLSDEDKKKAEELWNQQHGGSHSSHSSSSDDYHYEDTSIKEETDDAIHYTKEMIWKVMQSLAPNELIAESENYRDQADKWDDAHSKSTSLDSNYYTLGTVKKLINKKPEYDKKRHDTKEAEIFDLDNFKNFKGLTVNFDGLQDTEEHMGFADISILENKTNTTKEEMKEILHTGACIPTKLIGGIDGLSSRRSVYQCPWLNMAIWRPDVEQGVIGGVNKLRQSKGLKPLEYNVDLHAMGRYSAKRNNFELSYDGDVCADYGQGEMGSWLNKCLAGAESRTDPNCSDRYKAMSSYHNERLKAINNKEVYKKMDKDGGKLFGYNKEIGYLSFADNTGLTGQGMVKMLDTRLREETWTMTGQETLQFLDQIPNLKENILNPEMTKIGVGSIWNTPTGSIDKNGNTGIAIYTSK